MRSLTWIALALPLALTACGGGSGGSNDTPQPPQIADAALTVTGPTTAAAGSSLPLEIVISNSGNVAAQNVRIGGQFATGVTAFITGCTASGGAACPLPGGVFSIASLPANGSIRLEVIVEIAAGVTGTLSNTFSIAADNDSQSANNSATHSIRLTRSDLKVSGEGPSTRPVSGGTALYTMHLVNNGPDSVSNVALTNVVGPGQTLRSISCTATGGALCPVTLGPAMTAPLVPVGGRLTFTVNVDVGTATLGFIFNTLSAAHVSDITTSDNTATGLATTEIPAAAPTLIQLHSESGDYIGQGRRYEYTKATASLTLNHSSNTLRLIVAGDEHWDAGIAMPEGYVEFVAGTYSVERFRNASKAGVDWGGEGRGCNQITGTLTIDRVVYTSGAISELDVRFKQQCESTAAPVLHGLVHWRASDTTVPPPPQLPPPSGLWEAPAGATPASGNFVYLQSYVRPSGVLDKTELYTQANSTLNISSSGALLSVSIDGDARRSGNMQAMNTISQLQPGYYGGLRSYPFHNPVRGGINWTVPVGVCPEVSGWFVVDSVTYSGTTLTSIDLRFEQRCDGAVALHGKVHWATGDTTAPAGPQVPPPPGLWDAAPGATPTSGNYVYVQSDAGDVVGQGTTQTFTQANSLLRVTASNGYLSVFVSGDARLSGDFQVMTSVPELQPGYYGSLKRYPFHNPARGGMSWSRDGSGCSEISGWFVIDRVSFVAGTVTAIDARFEQHCNNAAPALHGKIHWEAGDTTSPPGPQFPVPAGLWDAAPGATPVGGNYVYLKSDVGEYVGQGQTNTYTHANSTLRVSAFDGYLSLWVDGALTWVGDFKVMESIPRLQVGYYGGLRKYPIHNPTRGGMNWAGNGRGCGEQSGWFAIDNVTFVGTTLTSIDLRFEQICDGATAALHGKIHWVAADAPTSIGSLSSLDTGSDAATKTQSTSTRIEVNTRKSVVPLWTFGIPITIH